MDAREILLILVIASIILIIIVVIRERIGNTPNYECKTNSNCPGAQVCAGNVCVDCAFDSDCPGSDICLSNNTCGVDSSPPTCGCDEIEFQLQFNPATHGQFVQNLTYSTQDDLFYRWIGFRDGEPVSDDGMMWHTIDPVNYSLGPNLLTNTSSPGDIFDESPSGLAYDPADNSVFFFVWGDLYKMSLDGQTGTFIGTAPYVNGDAQARSLLYLPDSGRMFYGNHLGSDPGVSPTIAEINPVDASLVAEHTVTYEGVPVRATGFGFALSPLTGTVYIVYQPAGIETPSDRRVGILDMETYEISDVCTAMPDVPINGIAIDNRGQMMVVTGGGQVNAENQMFTYALEPCPA